MKKISFYTIIALALLAAGCEKDLKILTKDYPYLVLDEISGVGGKEVTLSAEVISSTTYEANEYGFLMSHQPKPVITDLKIPMEVIHGDQDKFSARIDNYLISNQAYYIRAYIQTDSFIVYSNEKSFRSLGSMRSRRERDRQ